jgi:roadblock/LC7 domain-containing protein
MDRLCSLALGSFVLLAFAQGKPDARLVEHAFAKVPDGVEVSGEVVFSDDGSIVAYVGTRAGRSVPVVGDAVGEPFDFLDPPAIGARGNVAFRAGNRTSKSAEKWWVLLDGKRTGECDWIGTLSWSPDGARLAYWTQPGATLRADGIYGGGSMVLSIDGKRGAKWEDADALSPPAWSRDSKLVVTSAMKGGQWHVLVGERSVDRQPFVDGPVPSPDGKRVALAIAKSGAQSGPPPAIAGPTWIVACDKKRLGAGYDSAASPVFSPDGRRIAYKAMKGGKCGIAIDDEPAQLDFDFVAAQLFSPDSKRLAFAGATGCEIDASVAVTREGEFNVKGGHWKLVVDGRPEGESFDEIRDAAFSPDGARVAFRARTGAKWRIACAATRSDEFDQVGPPSFSADSKAVAFGARAGRELLWKVLALK